MVTTDQIYEYLETLVAEGKLQGKSVSLKQVQATAGLLMSAAQYYGDKASAQRFQFLAARAANKHEELASGEE